MTDIARLLASHPFLEGLSPDHLQQIADCATETEFSMGAYLFHEGDEATHLFLIRSGNVALQIASPNKTTETFQTLSECDFTGVSWLSPPYRLVFDAVAKSYVEAVVFDAACLRTKCDNDHDLGFELMQLFVPAIIERLKCARLKALDMYQTVPCLGSLHHG